MDLRGFSTDRHVEAFMPIERMDMEENLDIGMDDSSSTSGKVMVIAQSIASRCSDQDETDSF